MLDKLARLHSDACSDGKYYNTYFRKASVILKKKFDDPFIIRGDNHVICKD